MGAKKDDDDDLDTEIGGDADPDQGDDDDADDDDQEETLESVKEELAKTRAALRKANREATKKRVATKATPAKKATSRRATTDDDADDRADEVEAAERRAEERVIRTEGAVAILAAGFSGDRRAARDLAKLLDLDDLELDDDGEVDGLDEAVAALVKRFPRLFESDEEEKPRRRAAGSVNAARGSARRTRRDTEKPQTSAEKLGALLRGGR